VTHDPVLQTRSGPQTVPSAAGLLLSVQTGVPVEQLSVPVWQGSGGVQLEPALHMPHMPLEHTWLGPHIAPSLWSPLSAHTETPVEHDVVPSLQGFIVVQALPAAHDTHDPALQTLSVSHAVPLATIPPRSTHSTAGEQVVVPVWQGLAGTHASPSVQAMQAPLLQTLPVPHAVPLGALADSMQTGAPVLHAVMPTRHGLAAMEQLAPAAHATHAPAASQTLS
jgi:hypothetical protein